MLCIKLALRLGPQHMFHMRLQQEIDKEGVMIGGRMSGNVG